MVKFIDQTPLQLTAKYPRLEGLSLEDKAERMVKHAFKKGHSIGGWTILNEHRWIGSGRPFFNVYPKVLEALSRTPANLKPEDIPESVIHELGAICIKLPLDTPRGMANGCKHVIVTVQLLPGDPKKPDDDLRPRLMAIWDDSNGAHCWDIPFTRSFEEVHSSNREMGNVQIRPDIEVYKILRLVMGVMMLASDPDYIKPVLLKRDQGKTGDLAPMVARAKKRGVFGYSIGEDIERSPHFRRPHFAIRWTGKGSKIPKLVPVKGAAIGNKKLLEVPTGYEKQTCQ